MLLISLMDVDEIALSPIEGVTPQPNTPSNRTPPLYPYNRARY